jgi:hypothetical protein
MDAEEFRAIRLRLDPRLYAEARPKKRSGPGRPPGDQVSQRALADFLHVSERQLQRYEAGDEVPPLVAREMRRIDPGLKGRKKRGA